MNLTVVMVNFKSDRNKLNSCLESINFETEVLIIDHSNDLKIDQIKVPQNILLKIIKNDNLGNGAGINCGINNSKTKYILYLDIDTVLPKDFWPKLKDSIKKIDDFAVIAPKINNFYDETKIKRYGNLSFLKFYYNKFFHKIRKDKDFEESINQVFFVSGSIMLINKDAILKKNIKFDENIFLFFEEDDFFHQCFKSNLKIFLVNDIKATHLDGSVADSSLNYECFKKLHWEWSKYYFLNKHYNKFIILVIALKNLIKFSFKIPIFYLMDRKKFKIYISRMSGLIRYYLKKKPNQL